VGRLTPFAVFVLGIGSATVMAGVASLFIRSGWILVPIVLVSGVVVSTLMLRQWIRGPQEGRSASGQQTKARAEIRLEGAVGVLWTIVWVALTVMYAANSHPLCACSVPRNLIN
jgi:membrane protein implicated in regulation of membrane protease activity